MNVTEANTASFQVAGGFDSYQSVFGNFTLGNTNLFGGGESLIANAQVGFLFQNYSSVTPSRGSWIFRSAWACSYSQQNLSLQLQPTAAGFALTTTYPLTELGFKKSDHFRSRTYRRPGLQVRERRDQRASTSHHVPDRAVQGLHPDLRITPNIRRFTVDNPIDPRSGSVESLNLQFGGLGGNNEFIKGDAHFRYLYTFLKSRPGNLVFSQGITFGIGTNLEGGNGGELPCMSDSSPAASAVRVTFAAISSIRWARR